MPALNLKRFNRHRTIGDLTKPKQPKAKIEPKVKVEPKAAPQVEPLPISVVAPKSGQKRKPEKKKPEPTGETWFGVAHVWGSVSDLAELVLKAAKAEKILFRKLDCLGTFAVGRYTFVRMRADAPNLDKVFRRLRIDGMSLVEPTLGGYLVVLPDGRSGRVPASTIHTVTQMARATSYLGTKIKRWEQQFKAA